MRLSEAIRLGAMLRPQGFFDLWTVKADQLLIQSCALGAACDAFGCGYGHAYASRGLNHLPRDLDQWLAGGPVDCPACPSFTMARRDAMITHLNDRHRWTREAIADWVATLEGPPPDVAIDLPVPAVGPTAVTDDDEEDVRARAHQRVRVTHSPTAEVRHEEE